MSPHCPINREVLQTGLLGDFPSCTVFSWCVSTADYLLFAPLLCAPQARAVGPVFKLSDQFRWFVIGMFSWFPLVLPRVCPRGPF